MVRRSWGATAGRGRASLSGHSSVITAPLLVQKKRAGPATWPLCHACTPSTATHAHTQEGQVAPGGTASLYSSHVWRSSRAKQRGVAGRGERPRLNQGRGLLCSVPSSLISRLTILFPIPSSTPRLPFPLLPPVSLLYPVHLQPLSLGNKAEGFVYWRLEEKWGNH